MRLMILSLSLLVCSFGGVWASEEVSYEVLTKQLAIVKKVIETVEVEQPEAYACYNQYLHFFTFVKGGHPGVEELLDRVPRRDHTSLPADHYRFPFEFADIVAASEIKEMVLVPGSGGEPNVQFPIYYFNGSWIWLAQPPEGLGVAQYPVLMAKACPKKESFEKDLPEEERPVAEAKRRAAGKPEFLFNGSACAAVLPTNTTNRTLCPTFWGLGLFKRFIVPGLQLLLLHLEAKVSAAAASGGASAAATGEEEKE